MQDEDSDDEAPALVSVIESMKAASVVPTGKTQLPPCPVTILTGFLGSGKTTLIQHILKSPDHGKRIAVIENEFGEGLGVESLIARDGVDNSSLTDLIELPNGCMCCTVKDSLVTTLEGLLEKRSDLDCILIECSGMANPGPIASLFWLDDALESRLRLDGVVTMVDGKNICRQLNSTEEASQQVAYADRILLNKVDLLASVPTDASIEAITNRLHGINALAPIRTTSFAVVDDIEWILGVHSLESESGSKVQTPSETQQCWRKDCPCVINAPFCLPCNGAESLVSVHAHTEAVSTSHFILDGRVNLRRLDKWLATILWPYQDADPSLKEKTMQIFRIKGVVSTLDDPRLHIIQAVYDLWDVYPVSSDQSQQKDTIPQCKLVVIGRRLNEPELREGFRSCIFPLD